MMIAAAPLTPDPALLDEARAYLRIEQDEEDASLAGLAMAALAHAEQFANRLLLRRGVTQTVPASGNWTRLSPAPVLAVTGVVAIAADGTRSPLPPEAFAIDIDGQADAWVRLLAPGAARALEVTMTAGLAADWASLPEALRLGVLRLVGHLHAHRDRPDDGGPPAAVAALLLPWRRMRLR